MAVVLLVDDDAFIREVATLALREDGHQVRPAADAAELWAALDEAPLPDLILLDLRVPELDAAAASQALRAAPATARIPLIAVSGADPRAAPDGLVIDDWLAKPFDLDELSAMVARWVAR